MNELRCQTPLDAGILADYWTGLLNELQQEHVEEHLLTCDECAGRLREIAAVASGVRQLAREGALRVVVSDKFLDLAAEEGLRIRQYAPTAGGSVQCTVTPKDDLVIARLALDASADLRGARHVDLAVCDPTGNEMMRLKDVPFHADRREVIFNEPIAVLRTLTNEVLVVKMLAVEDQGERLLGEYTFRHYAS